MNNFEILLLASSKVQDDKIIAYLNQRKYGDVYDRCRAIYQRNWDKYGHRGMFHNTSPNDNPCQTKPTKIDKLLKFLAYLTQGRSMDLISLFKYARFAEFYWHYRDWFFIKFITDALFVQAQTKAKTLNIQTTTVAIRKNNGFYQLVLE